MEARGFSILSAGNKSTSREKADIPVQREVHDVWPVAEDALYAIPCKTRELDQRC